MTRHGEGAKTRATRSPATSLRARARRLLRLIGVRGVRRTARALVQAYLFSNRRWYLFTRPLTPGAHPPPSPEFEVRLATHDDLDAFHVFEPNRKRREFRAWLDAGALVFVALRDGQPVAFQCFSHSVPSGPPLSSLRLVPGQIWTVDVQTLPAYRRHHVAAALRAHRDDVLAARGIREYVSSVQDDNLPALSYAYGGPRRLVDRVGLLSYRCVLGFRRIQHEEDALPGLDRRLARAGLLPDRS